MKNFGISWENMGVNGMTQLRRPRPGPRRIGTVGRLLTALKLKDLLPRRRFPRRFSSSWLGLGDAESAARVGGEFAERDWYPVLRRWRGGTPDPVLAHGQFAFSVARGE
jgi:hypothetical protein